MVARVVPQSARRRHAESRKPDLRGVVAGGRWPVLPHMSKSTASTFTNLRLRMQKLVRSSATSTKTHLSGQHSADSLRARRRWSQRFPQRRPHKQSKPTGPAENC